MTKLALSLDQFALSLSNLTNAGTSKLNDLATGLAILSAVKVENIYGAIDAVIDNKKELNAIFDDSSFMYYMDKIASGVGVYGGETTITKERDEYMKKLLTSVNNIDINVAKMADKDTNKPKSNESGENKPPTAEDFISSVTDSISDFFHP